MRVCVVCHAKAHDLTGMQGRHLGYVFKVPLRNLKLHKVLKKLVENSSISTVILHLVEEVQVPYEKIQIP